MQQSTVGLIIFFSCLTLTIACGGAAFKLAMYHPKLIEPLFNTLLGLFAFGAGAIIGLIGSQAFR
jgi:hypothetical protein